jgi:DNA modification methylase
VVLAHKPFDDGISSYLDQYLLTETGFIDNRYLKSNVFNDMKEKVPEEFHHINRKPLSTMETLVCGLTKENHLILDPFMGSGTTGVACINTNRKFIGIEREKQNYDIAVNRINTASQDQFKRLFSQ